MAARNAIPSPPLIQIQRDFRAYWDGAEKSRLADPMVQRSLIATAHKFAVCFTQLSRAKSADDEHRRIFLQEMASDAIHLVHVLVGGDARGARFYLRSVIENFWRHHYFRDHPVEYGWLHTRKKFYLGMSALREHCGYLNCFLTRLKPLIGDLTKFYAELSSSVHSTSSQTMVLRSTLEDIRLTGDQTPAVARDLRAVMRACLALCIYSERGTYLALHVNVQDILLGTLTAREKEWITIVMEEAEAQDLNT